MQAAAMREPTEVALDTDIETAAAVVVAALLAAVAMLWQLLLISSRREASLLISSRNHITSVLITCVQLLGPNTDRGTDGPKRQIPTKV